MEGNYSSCVVCGKSVDGDRPGVFVTGKENGWTCLACTKRLYSVPVPQSEKKCENCRFWDEQEGCRRYPPKVHWNDDGHTVYKSHSYPETDTDKWCGEWQQKGEGK